MMGSQGRGALGIICAAFTADNRKAWTIRPDGLDGSDLLASLYGLFPLSRCVAGEAVAGAYRRRLSAPDRSGSLKRVSQAVLGLTLLLTMPAFALDPLPHTNWIDGAPPPTDLETITVTAPRPPPDSNPITLGQMGGGPTNNPSGGREFSRNDGTSESQVASQVCPTAGNPIVLTTGNKLEPETDFVSYGQADVSLRRTYNKSWAGVGLFGKNWISNFDYKLAFGSESVNTCYPRPGGGQCGIGTRTVIFALRPDARSIRFVKQSDGTFLEDKASPIAKIVQQMDGTFVLYSEDHDVERYTSLGYVSQIADEHGVGWNFTYNGTFPTRITHTSGRYVNFIWSDGQLTSVRDPAGNYYGYSYSQPFGNGINLLTAVSKPGSPAETTAYYYEDATHPGDLTGKSYSGVRYSWFAYGNGRLISEHHAGGNDQYGVAYSGGPNGELIATLTNPLGKQTVYTSLGNKLLAVDQYASTHCGSAAQDYTYDANGFTDKVTDFNGNVTDYDYSANGQLLKMVEASGTSAARTTTYTWDTQRNRMTTITLLGLAKTTYTYTAYNRLGSLTVTNLSGNGVANQTHVTTYTYSTYANGMVASMAIDGPLAGTGDMLIERYDSLGNLISKENGLGHAITYSAYNGLGLPGRVVGINGDTTDYTYDPRGRITNIRTYPNGAAANASYSYDAQGLLASSMTADGVVSFYEYDASRRLLETFRAANGTAGAETSREKQVYSYDPAGNLIKVENQKLAGQWETQCFKTKTIGGMPECVEEREVWAGTPTTTQTAFTDYDELNRIIARRGNDGQSTRFGYDSNSNVKSVTDSLGRVTTMAYDPLDRLLTSTDAKGGITRFAYDPADHLDTVTDPRGVNNTYVYDGFGQLWAQSSPDSGVSKFQYDASGLRALMTRASAETTTFAYDSLGRLVTLSAGGQTQAFAYDICSNGKGLLCKVTDPTGSSSYTYTPQGQLATQAGTMPANGSGSFGYSYDNMGRIAGISYPGGVSAGYGYINGKLTTIAANVGGVTRSVASYINHQPYGGISSWTYGNGLNRGYNYDLNGRLTGVSTGDDTSVLQSLTYAYNANDVITKVTNGINANLTQAYGYDELSRLTSITAASANQMMAYDAAGNRVTHTWGGATDYYTSATTSNRLLSISGARPKTFILDANGNVTAVAGANYDYDPFNRLDSATKAGVTTAYAVNALGQRIYKKVGVINYWFAYAPDGSLLSEYKTGQGWTHYIRLGGEPIAIVRGGQLNYVHNDHLGRPELVTNSAKTVVWRASNYAFDRAVALDSIGGLNIGFPGQYYDEETGSWNNVFRDYDASIGRYLQVDPLERHMPGASTYVYVRSNPALLIDPLGLEWQYSQSTGQLSHNGTPVGTGYAGHGLGLNNSAMQNISGIGPLPQGTYTIGSQRNSPNTGPATMNLTPTPGTETYGRSAFRIHGDNHNGDRSASHGCVVLVRSIRDEIAVSGDNTMVVGP